MARMRKASEPPPPGPPQVSPEKGLELLRLLIEKGKALLSTQPVPEDEYGNWNLLTRNYLEKAFGVNSPNVSSVTEIGAFGAFPMDASEEWWERRRAENLSTKLHRIEGLIELLQTEIQLSAAKPAALSPSAGSGHRIFLVHGRDDALLHETARFLEKLGQQCIVLREQPNQGRTIIEKFEDYADVGYSIVMLTPDDRGGPVAETVEELRPRARQNVILELGYFLGRLGRNRVCALYRAGVEIPSDYSGVLYLEVDGRGGWKLELAKELKAAGFPIDMNLAL